MKYSIEKLPEHKVIRVTVYDSLDQKTRKDIHIKSVFQLTLNGYNRLLIDVRNSTLSQKYSTGDTADMVKYMNDFEGQARNRIAYVFISEKEYRQNFVNAARHIYGLNIMSFHNQEDALAWLCRN